MSIYDLSRTYRELIERDDLDPQAVADTLDSIKDDMRTRMDNLAWAIEYLKKDSELLKDKAKSFNELAKSKENKAKFLQQYMTDVLDEAGIKELITDNHVLKPRNFKASVEIGDPDKLPLSFVNTETKVISKPDKQAIYKALKAGEAVDGARLVPNRKVTIR